MAAHRYLLHLLLLATIFIAHLCWCLDQQQQQQQHQQQQPKNRPVTLKNTRPTIGGQDGTSAHQKQVLNSRGKPKSLGGHKKHNKKFNETEFIKSIALQLSQDLSVQLPEINVGGYLTSAIGGAIGGSGGSSSKVLLKLHKTPTQAAPKIQSVSQREGGSLAKRPDQPVRPKRSAIAKESQRPLTRHKRQTPCNQGDELDDYVDQLFRFGTRIVRAMEPITLPNATIELPDYNLQIFLYDGKGTRAYKFKRTKPAWVFCSNETQSLGLTIEVEELRVAYKYRVISGDRLLFDGDLEAKLSPKLQVQFSQAVQPEDSEEPVMQRVDRIRLFRLGRVHVVIRGLGNLTQSLSMIINSYLNDNQEELQPTFRMVEGDAVKMINKMLANVNVPILNVV